MAKEVDFKSPLYVSGKPVGSVGGPKGPKSPEDKLGYLKAGK